MVALGFGNFADPVDERERGRKIGKLENALQLALPHYRPMRYLGGERLERRALQGRSSTFAGDAMFLRQNFRGHLRILLSYTILATSAQDDRSEEHTSELQSL